MVAAVDTSKNITETSIAAVAHNCVRLSFPELKQALIRSPL